MKRTTILALLLLVPLAFALGKEGEADGDQKIRETIKRIQEAEEEPDEPPVYEADEEEDEGSLLFEVLARIFSEIFWEYAFSVRFADYPYAENVDFYYSTTAFLDPWQTKAVSLSAAASLSCHFDGTCGNINRTAVHLGAFHVNLYNQNIFSRHEGIVVFSANGGFSLIIRGFALSGFLGVYKLDFLDTCQLSFGLCSQIFLPANLYLDLYNLNAVLNTVRFVHLAVSLNWTRHRLTVGLGFDYSNLAGMEYTGPAIRLGFWL